MSLSQAINTAQSSLSNTSTKTSVISRNISNAANPDYNRRSAVLMTTWAGASVATTQRSQNETLLRESLTGTAAAASQQTLLDGLSRLQSIFGGNDYETSPASLLAGFRDTLSTYAVKPSENTLAETAIADAVQLARGLQTASAAVQDARYSADQQIARDVDQLNSLLGEFQKANDAIVRGTQAGSDINNELDVREKLLKEISGIVSVSTVTRSGNDLAIYTTDGLTLFERVPRPVTFVPSSGYSATLTGNAVYIDGAALPPGEGASTNGAGSLQAHLQIRDTYAPTLQNQLDEIARGLVTVFAESDQSATPTLPDMPGLFTWAGGTVPSTGTLQKGIAASITVNPAVLSSKGGNPSLLRDGGINGAAYSVNPAANASFAQQLDAYVQAFEVPLTFDSAASLGASASLTGFAADSIGWLEQNRSEASSAAEVREAYRFRTTESYFNATGVSLDEEMSLLLELEQSYKASARLISAVDEMLQALLAAA
ncbi:flagellar hook-associated protein FlgK [Pseudohoeflea coraliihabitans]|uniref:Flagellar hook-associated protein 1 n=1 Tax=Pseudohoeflea coraliihabitans TaxID=2860393 RepID=A0ABS6WP04_9HYPH|nr:flagellar hook-associated protein FlgK [Pseudohoeflea sp. DP4N28-3]MBW3097353.1 flagellar hook-associated protein FlgK [Pseudohoeflea sp. DP4N28-3]